MPYRIVAALLLMSHVCAAQMQESARRPVQFQLAPLGSLIYPGCTAGMYYPVKVIDRRIVKKSGAEKTVVKEQFAALNYGLYHHADFHTHHWLTAEWLRQRRGRKRFFTEFALGLGYSRTLLGGATYRVGENGTITQVPAAGYSYLHVLLGAGPGMMAVSARRNFP